MPNTGRPSQACDACRKRRAKCDLVRPHCSQCIRHGKVCPGYRDVVDLRFRVENVSSYPFVLSRDNRRRRIPEELPSTTATVKCQGHKKVGRKKAETCHAHGNHAKSSIESTFTIDEGPRSFSSRPAVPATQFPLDSGDTDLQALIMAKMITISGPSHATDKSHHLIEVYNVLRRDIRQAAAGSPIQQICNAIGPAYISNESQPAAFERSEVHAYRSALAAIQAALHDPQQELLDSTLAMVWILEVYECLFMTHANYPKASSTQCDWCNTILRLIRVRGPEQFTRQDGRSLIWAVSYCIHSRCLMRNCEPPTEVLLWLFSIAKISSNSSDQLFIRIFTYVYHCTRLYSRIQACLRTNDLNHMLSISPSILQEIDCLERNVEPFTNSSVDDHHIPCPLASHPCLNPDKMSSQSLLMCIYLSDFRMHISSAALIFLQEISRSSACTPQQRDLFLGRQDQCIWEFWSVSERVLELFRRYNSTAEEALRLSCLGWVDAIMVFGALKTIAGSQLSLSWQRKMAQNSLMLFQKHSGMTSPA